jgi:hypothetical protein
MRMLSIKETCQPKKKHAGIIAKRTSYAWQAWFLAGVLFTVEFYCIGARNMRLLAINLFNRQKVFLHSWIDTKMILCLCTQVPPHFAKKNCRRREKNTQDNRQWRQVIQNLRPNMGSQSTKTMDVINAEHSIELRRSWRSQRCCWVVTVWDAYHRYLHWAMVFSW